MPLVIKALAFAAERHRDQRRKDAAASPYINHPIALASVLICEAGIQDVNVIAAALLHDTVEDTETTEHDLAIAFGQDIASIVMEVTDDKSLPRQERKRLQIQHARHMSQPAKLVKLADKICNLRDVAHNAPPSWSLVRRQEYFDWAKAVIDGLRGTHPMLERLFDAAYAARPSGDGEMPVAACQICKGFGWLKKSHGARLTLECSACSGTGTITAPGYASANGAEERATNMESSEPGSMLHGNCAADIDLVRRVALDAGYDLSHPFNQERAESGMAPVGLAIRTADGQLVSTCWNPLDSNADAFDLAADDDLFASMDYWRWFAAARQTPYMDKPALVRRAVVLAYLDKHGLNSSAKHQI